MLLLRPSQKVRSPGVQQRAFRTGKVNSKGVRIANKLNRGGEATQRSVAAGAGKPGWEMVSPEPRARATWWEWSPGRSCVLGDASQGRAGHSGHRKDGGGAATA